MITSLGWRERLLRSLADGSALLAGQRLDSRIALAVLDRIEADAPLSLRLEKLEETELDREFRRLYAEERARLRN